MDINSLTIGDIKQLQSLLGGAPAAKPAPTGRAIVVVDRGWIFAGDMSRAPNGDLRLDRAVHVFRWEGIGFAAMVEQGATSPKVDLRPVAPVEVPEDSVVFRVPVDAQWGLK